MKTKVENTEAKEFEVPARQYVECYVCSKKLEDGNKGPLCLKCAEIMTVGLSKYFMN